MGYFLRIVLECAVKEEEKKTLDHIRQYWLNTFNCNDYRWPNWTLNVSFVEGTGGDREKTLEGLPARA